MSVLHTNLCSECDKLYPDVWSDDEVYCCGKKTTWTPVGSGFHTPEWGGPRVIPSIRDEPFGSRGELHSFMKSKGMALGESSEKVGGARNEEHLNTGKIYSYGR